MIRAPFNFVPLSEKVFFPDWADEISQDIPFEDGVSGTIDLTITAESPIFIRNGHTKKDHEEQTDEYKSFSHVTCPDGKPIYFIPATSIKGEVRTLLEIMSYSKMTVDKRAQFARRDLNNSQLYPLKKKQDEIRCGWMKRNDDFSGYTVTSCGRPMRIMQMKIDEYLESIGRGSHVLENAFCKEKNRGPLPDGKRSATYKYGLLGDVKLDNLTFREKGRRRDKTKNLVYDPRGKVKGTIVLTGQPGYWKMNYGKKENRGKCYEFVFPSQTEETYEVTNEMFAHYAFIYENSDDWKRIKRLLDSSGGQGAPVFFRVSGNEILDFGMAYLYKMPYKNSVEESMPQNHRKSKADLAQCIFGYTDAEDIKDVNGEAISLKGRVQFGNAFADSATVRECQEVALPLQSPKASYLPLYVRQKNGNGRVDRNDKGKPIYKTYDDGHPSGWKAYYRRTATWGRQAPVNANQEDTQNTHFKPLDKGCVFKSMVSFHNLRPVELGALLCAINFAKSPSCHHLLGLAKPYGYGRCKYAAKLTLTTPGQGEAYFMEEFKKMMSRELKGDWLQQKEIESLFSIAQCRALPLEQYSYMHMDTNRNRNEYILAQNAGECLRPIKH